MRRVCFFGQTNCDRGQTDLAWPSILAAVANGIAIKMPLAHLLSVAKQNKAEHATQGCVLLVVCARAQAMGPSPHGTTTGHMGPRPAAYVHVHQSAFASPHVGHSLPSSSPIGTGWTGTSTAAIQGLVAGGWLLWWAHMVCKGPPCGAIPEAVGWLEIKSALI